MVTITHPDKTFTGTYRAGARDVVFENGTARDLFHPHVVRHFYQADGFTVQSPDEALEPVSHPAGDPSADVIVLDDHRPTVDDDRDLDA